MSKANHITEPNYLNDRYRTAISGIANALNWELVHDAIRHLAEVRGNGGRVFAAGLGGSAGNASHLANDFRKLAGIECYSITDNVSELTARINDDGWGAAMKGYLQVSALSERDVLLVLSVGGGDEARGVSIELVEAMKYALEVGASIIAIVGRDGGFAGRVAAYPIIIPTVDESLTTPMAESFQSLVWHAMVSHPDLAVSSAHWESLTL
jgi:D-sedoheptulose 7-phosphate isomerase